jgi:hypothetical protein
MEDYISLFVQLKIIRFVQYLVERHAMFALIWR